MITITVPSGALLDMGVGNGVKIDGVEFDVDGSLYTAAEGFIQEAELLKMAGATRANKAENYLKSMADDFADREAKKPDPQVVPGTPLLPDQVIEYNR